MPVALERGFKARLAKGTRNYFARSQCLLRWNVGCNKLSAFAMKFFSWQLESTLRWNMRCARAVHPHACRERHVALEHALRQSEIIADLPPNRMLESTLRWNMRCDAVRKRQITKF